MTELIEFDGVEALAAGAFGVPGQRTFVVQATHDGVVLSVLVEKDQVRILSEETLRFLDQLDLDQPEAFGSSWTNTSSVSEAVPLFRARMMGIGFDPARSSMVLELREWADDEPPEGVSGEARVARIFASRSQVRAMAENAALSVRAGRPLCRLCEFPMDQEGHWCPRSN